MKLKIPFLLRSWIIRILVIAAVITLAWIVVRSLMQVGAVPGITATDDRVTASIIDEPQQIFFMQAPGQGCSAGEQLVVQALLQDLASAQQQVHIAMYSFSINEIADVLVHLKGRGIPVQLIMESDNMDSTAVKKMIAAGIPIQGDQVASLMHDKFLVIDGRIVWTGSMNMTYTSLCEDLNNMVRIDDTSLAGQYDAEFSEMFDRGLFGRDSPADNHLMPAVINSHSMGVYFSPEDHVQQQLLDMIGIAQSSIEFLGYSFTSDPLAEALIEKSKQGVEVRGVMDAGQAASNTGGEYDHFRHAGLDVRLASTIGSMHHKVFIIDGQVVMLGSYNFTRSAEENNDENLLILHNPGIARDFQVEFERIYSTAKP
jgi:phosphatidylserine/phosphatidylglycerophosphate/cardiolipin synthase-like enzyme